MKICFIANYAKTYFFHEIAMRLSRIGVTISWIVVNRSLENFLLTHYSRDAVLHISKAIISDGNAALGDFKLNELVWGDRVLRHHPEWAYRFLESLQQPVVDFLRTRKIKFVFGEVTWAHEILIHRLIATTPELECKYYNPHTIRIPSDRFAFFKDEMQSIVVEKHGAELSSLSANDIISTIKKPDYLHLNDARNKVARSFGSRFSRFTRFMWKSNRDALDPTIIENKLILIKLRAAEEINKELYRMVATTKFNPLSISRNYVFFALHKQPEASIDVIGRYYEDQYANILNVWRAMPADWSLLVKEHSNAIGDRSPGFYKKVKRLRNAYLIDEKEDSHAIISQARAVVTVSGTVAFEAALLGIPSFTFGPVFFNRLPSCQRIDLSALSNNFEALINRTSCDLSTIAPFRHWLYSNSHPGLIGDPIADARTVHPVNLDRVSRGFRELLGVA